MSAAQRITDSLSACPCAEPLMYVAFVGGLAAAGLVALAAAIWRTKR